PALRMPDQNIVDSTPCQFELRCSSNIGCTHTPPIASVTEASETLIGELYRRIASEMLYSRAFWICSIPFDCTLMPMVLSPAVLQPPLTVTAVFVDGILCLRVTRSR